MDTEKEGRSPCSRYSRSSQIADSEIAVLSITNGGKEIASRIHAFLPEAGVFSSPLSVDGFIREFIQENWNRYSGFIFIMAAGIVVRTISPFIKDKKTDPAVLVIDERGEFVISLLSGHLGGANELTKRIAGYLGAKPVITTASDVSGLPALDLWAKENGLAVEDWRSMTKAQARLINNGSLRIYRERNVNIKMPKEFLIAGDPDSADVLITNKTYPALRGKDILFLRPRNLIIGIGCNRGTQADEIDDMVRTTFEKYGLSFKSIKAVATIEQKRDEDGLLKFARTNGIEITFFSAEELNSVEGIGVSEAAFKATGANGVAEPSALLAAIPAALLEAQANIKTSVLLVPKHKKGNVTLAAAEMRLEEANAGKGKIYVVGTGPGNIRHITPAAQKAIRESDVIIGYRTYIELAGELIKDKEVLSFSMTQEIDRCRKAIEIASSGRSVALICGGDPGIYAMGGLVFEILREILREILGAGGTGSITGMHDSGIQVEIIPGIPAINAVASRLGAPLMHDFSSVSLSDLLTPWEVIEKRLIAAASSDFVIVLYNPRSKGRREQIKRARDLILLHRSPLTPVGIVKAAMRDKEKIILTNLGGMTDHEHEIDMQTTIIIGNSKTFIWKEWMVTPRGYHVPPLPPFGKGG